MDTKNKSEQYGCENCDYIGTLESLKDHVIATKMKHTIKKPEKAEIEISRIVNLRCSHPRYEHGCQECNYLSSQLITLFQKKEAEHKKELRSLEKTIAKAASIVCTTEIKKLKQQYREQLNKIRSMVLSGMVWRRDTAEYIDVLLSTISEEK